MSHSIRCPLAVFRPWRLCLKAQEHRIVLAGQLHCLALYHTCSPDYAGVRPRKEVGIVQVGGGTGPNVWFEEVGTRPVNPKCLRTSKSSIHVPGNECDHEKGPGTLRKEGRWWEVSQQEMASRQEQVVPNQCTGMMNHACDGSQSRATSLFTAANEASAVTNTVSECCGWGRSKGVELRKKDKGSWRLDFLACFKKRQNHSVRMN